MPAIRLDRSHPALLQTPARHLCGREGAMRKMLVLVFSLSVPRIAAAQAPAKPGEAPRVTGTVAFTTVYQRPPTHIPGCNKETVRQQLKLVLEQDAKSSPGSFPTYRGVDGSFTVAAEPCQSAGGRPDCRWTFASHQAGSGTFGDAQKKAAMASLVVQADGESFVLMWGSLPSQYASSWRWAGACGIGGSANKESIHAGSCRGKIEERGGVRTYVITEAMHPKFSPFGSDVGTNACSGTLVEERDRIEIDDTIEWVTSDFARDAPGNNGTRRGDGELHAYASPKGGAISGPCGKQHGHASAIAPPVVTVSREAGARVWRVTKVQLSAVREVNPPLAEAFAIACKTVFDNPDYHVLSPSGGHWEDVIKNFENYNENHLAALKWWTDGVTEAHESSHLADHQKLFREQWAAQGGLKENLKQRLEAVLTDFSQPTAEDLQKEAESTLASDIKRRFASYVPNEKKAYEAGKAVFDAKAKELRDYFAPSTDPARAKPCHEPSRAR